MKGGFKGTLSAEIETDGITGISVLGFKSLVKDHSIKIRPLTILAGANSSGKTSIIQPMLMMKQTLHESYDPGDLKINGPNVKFTRIDQFLSKYADESLKGRIEVQIEIDGDKTITEIFAKQDKNFKLIESIFRINDDEIILYHNMTHEEIIAKNKYIKKIWEEGEPSGNAEDYKSELKIERYRCFLKLYRVASWKSKDNKKRETTISMPFLVALEPFEQHIAEVIHVPALRGNPKRNYDITAIGPAFPGTFENYVASIIKDWQSNDDSRLHKLNEWLRMLNLTQRVVAKQIDDTSVEIFVGCLPPATNPETNDLVSIADVGFGVSQTLPVLVALLTAKEGQLVYIEQPEIHLHPRAQVAMAQILANAAKDGIRVVVETHSALLLRGIQTVVAEGNIVSPKDVIFHWFERNAEGITEIRSADLDEAGSFGEWPIDFADILMRAECDYIEAAEAHLRMEY